jgi:hypothetical protein
MPTKIKAPMFDAPEMLLAINMVLDEIKIQSFHMRRSELVKFLHDHNPCVKMDPIIIFGVFVLSVKRYVIYLWIIIPAKVQENCCVF